MEPLTFGERLRESRAAAKLTQKQVAKKAGMAQGTLSELENDKYPASALTPRLAHIYGVSARWLADGAGPRVARASESQADLDLWPFERLSRDDYRNLPERIKGRIEERVNAILEEYERTLVKTEKRA